MRASRILGKYIFFELSLGKRAVPFLHAAGLWQAFCRTHQRLIPTKPSRIYLLCMRENFAGAQIHFFLKHSTKINFESQTVSNCQSTTYFSQSSNIIILPQLGSFDLNGGLWWQPGSRYNHGTHLKTVVTSFHILSAAFLVFVRLILHNEPVFFLWFLLFLQGLQF